MADVRRYVPLPRKRPLLINGEPSLQGEPNMPVSKVIPFNPMAEPAQAAPTPTPAPTQSDVMAPIDAIVAQTKGRPVEPPAPVPTPVVPGTVEAEPSPVVAPTSTPIDTPNPMAEPPQTDVIDYHGMILPNTPDVHSMIQEDNRLKTGSQSDEADAWAGMVTNHEVLQAQEKAVADRQAELQKSHEHAFKMSPEDEKLWADIYGGTPDALKPLVGGAASVVRGTGQLAANSVSGLAQIPGDIAGAINLGGVIYGVGEDLVTGRYGTNPINGKDVPLSLWDQVMTAGQRRMFKEGGYEALNNKLNSMATEVLTAHPNMNPQDAIKQAQAWLDTDEGYQFFTEQLAYGFQMQQQSNWFANGLAGVGLRPDQQTILDDLEQVGAQSVFGLPKYVINAIEKGAIKIAGKTVVQSLPMQFATRVLEAATPITLPYTAKNVAVNAAVGTAITETIRDLGNQPSLLNGPDPDVVAEVTRLNAEVTARGGPDKLSDDEIAAVNTRGDEIKAQLSKQAMIDPPDGQGVNIDGQIDSEVYGMAGLSIGAIFSIPALMRQVEKNTSTEALKGLERGTVEMAAGRTKPEGTTFGGATVAEQGAGNPDLKPLLDPLTGKVSGAAAVSAGVRKTQTSKAFEAQFGYEPTARDLQDWRDGTYVQVETQLAGGTRAARLEAESDLIERGILDGKVATIAYKDILRTAQEMERRTPGKYNNTFREYAMVEQRLQNQKATLEGFAEQIMDVRKKIIENRAGSQQADTLALEKQHADLLQRYSDLATDQPHTRDMLEHASIDELKALKRRAESDPEIMALRRMTEKFNDDVANFGVSSGLFTEEAARVFKEKRGWYIPVNEAELAGEPSILKRGTVWLRDKTGIGDRELQSSYLQPRPQSREQIDKRDLGVINEPRDPLISLMEHALEIVRDATSNNVRRNVTETMESVSGARGVLYRPITFKRGKGTTEWLTDGEVGIHKGKISSTPNSYQYKDKGLTRVIQMSDEGMGEAMKFAPQAAIPILNATRTFWQRGQTGKFLRPDFALTTAMWSTGQAKMNLTKGRSMGVIDTNIRKLSGENPLVNAVMDHIGILPDHWLSAAIGIPTQLAHVTAGKVGKAIADDLMHGSGLFGVIGKTKEGRRVLEAGGRAMYKWYERSTTHAFHHNIPSSSVAVKEADRIGNDYRLASRGNAGNRAVTTALDMYAAAVDAVRGAAHYAVFAENYGREKFRLGGEEPSEAFMKSLQYDIMNLTGDMTRSSSSKAVQRFNSIVPYGNSILQGTSYIASAMIGPNMARGINAVTGGAANLRTYRSNRFWSQLITGAILPTWGSMALLEAWGDEAKDYWYNKQPEWFRSSHMILPKPDLIIHAATHGWDWGKWNPDNMYELPIAPEISMFLIPTMGAMRAMGMGPPIKGAAPGPLDLMWNAVKQATNFVTPPTAQLAAALGGKQMDMHALMTGDFDSFIKDNYDATFGGVNADMMSSNSQIPSRLYEAAGAILGSTGKLIAESLNAGEIAGRKDKNGKPQTNPVEWLMEASASAWDTGSLEFMKRVPDLPGLPMMDRNYSFTPESEFVMKTQHTLEPIIGTGRQQSVESDTQDRAKKLKAMGLIAPEDLASPLLKAMTDQVYGYFKRKGPFTDADKKYTGVNIDLRAIDGMRYKVPDSEYQKSYSALIHKKQQIKAVQSMLITRFDKQWQQHFGKLFEKQTGLPLNFQNFVRAVRDDITSQGGK